MINEKALYNELYIRIKTIESALNDERNSMDLLYDKLKNVFTIENEKVNNESLESIKKEINIEKEKLSSNILLDIKTRL